ncbi:MAG: ACT domain-containing protein [Chloroflexota bacterium]|nr:ACT domain-containing protein [Chloroflexota bacterium]
MPDSKVQASGLIQNDHLAMIGIMDIPSHPGVGGEVFSALSDQGINVELIVHLIDLEEKDHIVLCVDRDDLSQTLEIAERIREKIGGQAITSDPEVASVSLFGLDFREQRGVASQMFKALGDCNINIRAISTSISTISCLIEAQHLDKAIHALRDAFTLL